MPQQSPADLGGAGEKSNAPQTRSLASATKSSEKSSFPPNDGSQQGSRRATSRISQITRGGNLGSRMKDESEKKYTRSCTQQQLTSTSSTNKSSSCTSSNVPKKCNVITQKNNKPSQKSQLIQNQKRQINCKNKTEANLIHELSDDSSLRRNTMASRQQVLKESHQPHTTHEKGFESTVPRNFRTQTESAEPSSRAITELSVQTKLKDELVSPTNADESSMNHLKDSGKRDTLLPPLKMTKTPALMRQLVTNIVRNQITIEPPQFKRRYFVKLPPLSKKTGNGPWETNRKYGIDRKTVNSRKLPDGRGVSVLKRGNVQKLGNEQQIKIKPINGQGRLWK